MKKSVQACAVVAGVAVLAACNTTGGEPVAASSSGAPAASSPASTRASAGPTVPVPAGLDFGAYPSRARTITTSENRSWVVEGNRMGDEALIQANEVDPRLIIGGAGLRSFPVLDGDGLRSRVPDATATAFHENTMRVGMTTTRGDALDKPTVAVRIGLYRFDSPEAAKKAVDAIRTATASARKVRVTADGAPDVVATEFKPGTVDAYVAQGAFVVNVSGTGPTTDQGAQFVTKAYGLELPKLKAFTPTPVDRIRTLDLDRDGILSRTLPAAGELDPTAQENWYTWNGQLHRIQDITKTETYLAAGIDLIGNTGSGSVVYRTRDAAAATTMVQTIAGKNPAVAGIPQLPSVKCMTGGDLTYCWIPVGRYVASVYDTNAALARQKAAAQFSILATTP
ncbi:hypothetical protein FK529_13215 [Tsukamurella asaccharolytica]|uniref:Uncharacterized protein n=1 Tax=Tsukamurella asaccharolytica TaxID=2592067 RepID=A0A5C5R9C2_9ACTN|nr:hypothetical protein [Tsukamurella asaccharolytica]TWS18933.1 hypothetical protein FK529_13215 [Tsukamurella asaccharolytica]